MINDDELQAFIRENRITPLEREQLFNHCDDFDADIMLEVLDGHRRDRDHDQLEDQ